MEKQTYCSEYGKKKKETDIKNRLIDMERGEETGRCMERVTWKLILPYVK